jgi:hypothetical protein
LSPPRFNDTFARLQECHGRLVVFATHGHCGGLLGHRLLRLLHRLLRHVAFVLEGGHLVLHLYAGHLRGHDLDLLVGPTRPAGSADLPDVVLVGDIPASHVFLGVDWVCWLTPRMWPPFIASFLGGNWPPGTQTIPVGAGNMETRVGGKPKPPWTGTIYGAREAGHAISVPSPLEAERHY